MEWLEYVSDRIENRTNHHLHLSQSDFNPDKTETNTSTSDTTAMIPMFCENSKSAAMINQSLDMILKGDNSLNEGQPIVVTLDQPLYAIAKRVQWQWPEEYSIHKIIFMLGGLHTEMEFLSALGDWLECGSWVAALKLSLVATSSLIFICCKSIWYAFALEVTLCTLETLFKRAHHAEVPSEPFKALEKSKGKIYSQFKFWSLTGDMELLLLCCVRCLRFRDFKLFVESWEKILPFFFALNHLNYARWYPRTCKI